MRGGSHPVNNAPREGEHTGVSRLRNSVSPRVFPDLWVGGGGVHSDPGNVLGAMSCHMRGQISMAKERKSLIRWKVIMLAS